MFAGPKYLINPHIFLGTTGHPLPGQVSTLPGNTWNVFFDVSSLPSQEALTGAELRLPFSVAKSADSESVPHEPSRVNVYQVLKPEKGGLPASTRLIDTTTAAAEGSVTFDLTKTVRHWLFHPKDNFGLQVQLVTSKDSPVFDEKSDETSSADKIPFLVTYSDDPEQVYHHTTRPNEDDASTRTTTRSACQKHAWTINFRQLYGSNNFVIAPTGLHANYCHGECRFPLSSHMNATNHAVFQVLGNLRDSNIPRPCCAPTKLSTTRMLITENNNVVYKNYTNAVVDECGCL